MQTHINKLFIFYGTFVCFQNSVDLEELRVSLFLKFELPAKSC